jgi:cyclase
MDPSSGRTASPGAGELCVNSIDADGTKEGYELKLTRMICDAVSIRSSPGRRGTPEHMAAACQQGPRQRRAHRQHRPLRRILHPRLQERHEGPGVKVREVW